MINGYTKELITAKNIALQTWQLISSYYDKGLKIEKKEDGSPVTQADKLANRFIIDKITEIFPNDSIVSEEDFPIIKNNRTWYIDPIDGTKGFIKRNGHFAIHIGFCENDQPTLGIVYWPVVNDLYYGIISQGAWRENSRGIIELKNKKIIKDYLIATTNGDSPTEELKEIFKKLNVKEFHNSGSEGLRLMKIAENRSDIRISEKIGTNTWDLCAPHAIFKAAGGEILFMDGNKISYNKQRMLNKRYIASYDKNLLMKSIELCRDLN